MCNAEINKNQIKGALGAGARTGHYTSEGVRVKLGAVGRDIARGQSRDGNARQLVDTPAVASGRMALCGAVQRCRSRLADWNEDVTGRVGPVERHGARPRLRAPAVPRRRTATPAAAAAPRRCNAQQPAVTDRPQTPPPLLPPGKLL